MTDSADTGDSAATGNSGAKRFSIKHLLIATAVVAYFVAPLRWLGGFYVASLVLSLVVLGLVLSGVRRKATIGPIAFCLIPAAPILLAFISPVALLHALLTAIVLVVTYPIVERRRWRAIACGGAMVAAYGWLFVVAGLRAQEIEAFRQAYPIVSVADRLPPAAPETPPAELSPVVESRLGERELAGRRRWWHDRRHHSLERLHTQATSRFVAAAGFGVMRAPTYISLDEENLLPRPRMESLADLALHVSREGDLSWQQANEAMLGRFFDHDHLGYVVGDNAEAAGFEPHALRQPARAESRDEGDDSLSVTRLELIGLLRHAEPVVYLTAGLPSMDQAADAATRPLDEFESTALPRLVAEKDVVFEEQEKGVRMVGAIRAAEQCLACHAAQRGQLLGAFSYDLVADLPAARSEDP